MSDSPYTGIILCQPDNSKGCSLCCGLLNFTDISTIYLSAFLNDGEIREKRLSTFEEYDFSEPVRDRFTHICPYQGFLHTGKPGCLIHPLSSGHEGRDRSLFASRICDKYFCPAHTILTEKEKQFLIDNVPDWILYSTAIADPESYSFIYNYVKDKFKLAESSHTFRMLINEGLSAHTENLSAYKGIIFCYSIPEYNTSKINFSLRYINKTRGLVVSRINNTADFTHL